MGISLSRRGATASSRRRTNVTVPGAPTIGTATGGVTSASVTFSAPGSNGGTAIIDYTVTSSLGPTATGASSPITVSGLATSAQTFTVKARNSVGSSAASAASNSVTPTAAIVAPTVVNAATLAYATGNTTRVFPSVTVGTGDVVAVTARTGYYAQTYVSAVAKTAGTATIGGVVEVLEAGVTGNNNCGNSMHSFQVTAGGTLTVTITFSGTSPTSRYTDATMYVATGSAGIGTSSSHPGSTAPTVTIVPRIHSCVVAAFTDWNVGATNALTWTPSGQTEDVAFTDGVTHKTTSGAELGSLEAHWPDIAGGSVAYGLSAPSFANINGIAWEFLSNAVTTVPGAPTIGTATAGVGSASVTFTAPGSNGGVAIDTYRVTSSLGPTATYASSPVTISGLAASAQTFTVAAHNTVGYGAESAASNSVTPTASSRGGATLLNIKTSAQWKTTFDGLEPNAYSLLISDAATAGSDKIYQAGYYWEGYVSMYEATGDPSYLSRMAATVQAWINVAQTSNSFSGSSFKDTRLGWVSKDSAYAPVGDEAPLPESYGWRFVTRMLYHMKNEPTLATTYQNQLSFTEQNIWSKWYERGLDSYLYRVNTHMASHWGIMGMMLASITADSTLQTQCTTVSNNIMYAGIPTYSGASIRGQMINNPANAAAFFFNYDWNQFAQPGSDVAHGEGTFTGCFYASLLGMSAFGPAEMTKFKVLLDQVIWPTGGNGAAYVDGSGTGNGWIDGWVKLGAYDDNLQLKLESSGRSDISIWFAGNMCLGAKLWGK